jgi:hypothetical protein
VARFELPPLAKYLKSDFRERFEQETPKPRVFSKTAAAALARKFGILGDKQPKELCDALNGWSETYWIHRLAEDDRLPARLRRQAVRKIQPRVKALRHALDSLDENTKRLFWSPDNQVSGYLGFGRWESPYGHTIHTAELDEKTTQYWFIQKGDHFEALSILEKYCELALAAIPQGTPGRDRRESVRMWVVNVIYYWEDFLKRRFTIDYQQGAPVSPGARFCVEAFSRVDARVSAQELITAMRNEQRRIRALKARKK